MALSPGQTFENHNSAAYLIVQNPGNLKYQCFAQNGDQFETDAFSTPQVCDIQVTNTGGSGSIGEVIFKVGGTECLRTALVSAVPLYPKQFATGTLSSTQQNGFS